MRWNLQYFFLFPPPSTANVCDILARPAQNLSQWNRLPQSETSKAEKIIKTLYRYLIKNNKKFILSDHEKKWGLERSVSDFIAGMTDKFAIDLYNKIK